MDGVLEGVCCGGAGGGDGCLSDDAVDGDGECGVGSALGVGDGVVEVDGEGELLAGGVDLGARRSDSGDLRCDAVDLYGGEVVRDHKRGVNRIAPAVVDGSCDRRGHRHAVDVEVSCADVIAEHENV